MSEIARDAEWQRLDPRMLLVHPIRELIRFLPVLIVIMVARTAGGGEKWQLIGVAFPIALGVLRYLTTSFRIAAGRIELQRMTTTKPPGVGSMRSNLTAGAWPPKPILRRCGC